MCNAFLHHISICPLKSNNLNKIHILSLKNLTAKVWIVLTIFVIKTASCEFKLFLFWPNYCCPQNYLTRVSILVKELYVCLSVSKHTWTHKDHHPHHKSSSSCIILVTHHPHQASSSSSIILIKHHPHQPSSSSHIILIKHHLHQPSSSSRIINHHPHQHSLPPFSRNAWCHYQALEWWRT